jgi:hypothetical protein
MPCLAETEASTATPWKDRAPTYAPIIITSVIAFIASQILLSAQDQDLKLDLPTGHVFKACVFSLCMSFIAIALIQCYANASLFPKKTETTGNVEVEELDTDANIDDSGNTPAIEEKMLEPQPYEQLEATQITDSKETPIPHELFDKMQAEFRQYTIERKRHKSIRKLNKNPLPHERIATSINFLRKYSFEELIAAYNTKNQKREAFRQACVEKIPFSDSFSPPQQPPRLFETSGICSGMVHDLARQLLLENKSIGEIAAQMHKGARIDAEAIQDLCSNLPWENIRTPWEELKSSFEKLTLESKPDTLLSMFQDVDMEEVGLFNNLLHQASEHLKTNQPCDITRFCPKTAEIPSLQQMSYIPALAATLDQAIRQANLDADGKIKSELLLQTFSQILNNNLKNSPDHELATGIHSLWTQEFSLALTYTFENIKSLPSDHPASIVMKSCRDEANFVWEEVRVGLHGLKIETVSSILGRSEFLENDEEYLENTEQLDPGAYEVMLMTKFGLHAIAFIKNESGEGHIFDPNPEGGLYPFKDEEHAKTILKDLLTIAYPLKECDNQYHNLKFYKLSAA